MNSRTIDGVGVLVIASVVGLLYAVGVRPLQSAHAETVKLRTELWFVKGTLGERRASEENAASTAKQLTDRLEQLDIQLSDLDQLNTRIAELTHLAEDHGLNIETLRPGDQVSEEKYRAIAITLIGRVDYLKASEFLAELRHQYPDTGLQTMTLDRLPGDETMGRLQIGMVWYAAPAGRAGSAAGNP